MSLYAIVMPHDGGLRLRLVRPATYKLRSWANDISPCFGFGPGDRPHSSLIRLPHFEGDGAPTRRTAWIARPEVGTACGRAWAKRHAPRLAARQRGIFGLRLSQRSGRTRSSVSLEGYSRGRPWVRVA